MSEVIPWMNTYVENCSRVRILLKLNLPQTDFYRSILSQQGNLFHFSSHYALLFASDGATTLRQSSSAADSTRLSVSLHSLASTSSLQLHNHPQNEGRLLVPSSQAPTATEAATYMMPFDDLSSHRFKFMFLHMHLAARNFLLRMPGIRCQYSSCISAKLSSVTLVLDRRGGMERGRKIRVGVNVSKNQ